MVGHLARQPEIGGDPLDAPRPRVQPQHVQPDRLKRRDADHPAAEPTGPQPCPELGVDVTTPLQEEEPSEERPDADSERTTEQNGGDIHRGYKTDQDPPPGPRGGYNLEDPLDDGRPVTALQDRKSTRLNSSHT